MPALLLAGFGETPEAAAVLDELAAKHGGCALPSRAGFRLLSFDKPAPALACALAAQARVAENNRAAPDSRLARVRFSLHWSAGAPEKDGKTLSLLQEVTPLGRVLVTRPVFAQSHGARACAFIPLGAEYLSGLPDPLDLLEAVPVVGALRTLAPAFTDSASMPSSAPRPRTPEPNAAEAPAPSILGFLAAPVVLACVIGGGLLLSLAAEGVSYLLTPLDLLDYAFFAFAHLALGLGGEDAGASAAALLLPILMPVVLFLRALWSSQRWPAYISLFWLGQFLLSWGVKISAPGGADMNSFQGAVKLDGIELAKTLGLLAHYNAAAHAATLAGCVLLCAAAAGCWSSFRRA